jgi:hypothetical protein
MSANAWLQQLRECPWFLGYIRHWIGEKCWDGFRNCWASAVEPTSRQPRTLETGSDISIRRKFGGGHSDAPPILALFLVLPSTRSAHGALRHERRPGMGLAAYSPILPGFTAP